ncbi:MAG: phosphatidate cytidylyltransferase [Candidatus Aminicenantes bacterium]|nr:phosphatidate cytidylyltransferase [Candidatus Aminicenantes bacterium]
MKEFLTRTTTAVFLIIGAYVIIKFVPPLYFSLLLFLLISAGAYEFIKLTAPGTYSKIVLLLSGAAVGLSFTFGKPALLETIMIVVVLNGLFFLFAVRRQEKLATFVRDIGIHFAVVFYLYIPLYFLLELKKLGANYLFFLIFVIAIGDSFAYFLGRAIGRHKIYPVASPKKSLEGLIAAIVFAAVSGWLALLVFPVKTLLNGMPVGTPLAVWVAVVSGGLTGLFSQLSDPIESLFKRAAGKKDSGAILPGHGGILDRVDSYVFCAPVLYFIIKYFWV